MWVCCTHQLFQATLFKMGQRIIEENEGIREVRYALPNKHYIPVNMEYIGIDNLTPCVFFISFFVPFHSTAEGSFRSVTS